MRLSQSNSLQCFQKFLTLNCRCNMNFFGKGVCGAKFALQTAFKLFSIKSKVNVAEIFTKIAF